MANVEVAGTAGTRMLKMYRTLRTSSPPWDWEDFGLPFLFCRNRYQRASGVSQHWVFRKSLIILVFHLCSTFCSSFCSMFRKLTPCFHWLVPMFQCFLSMHEVFEILGGREVKYCSVKLYLPHKCKVSKTFIPKKHWNIGTAHFLTTTTTII